MTPDTLIMGIAGIVATLIASGLGLYFTARARSAPLRELLYAKQIKLLLDVLRAIGRIRVFVPLLLDEESPHKERAREDIRKVVKKFSQLTDAAAAVLPTELYAEISGIGQLVVDFLVDYDAGREREQFPDQLLGRASKTALLARTLLGTDELSEESLALFATSRSLEELSQIEPLALLRSVRGKSET